MNYVGCALSTSLLHVGSYTELEGKEQMLHPGEGNLPKRHQLRSELKARKDIPHSLQAPETRPPLLIWLGYTCKRKGITISRPLLPTVTTQSAKLLDIHLWERKNPQNQAATLCNAVFTLYCHTVTSMSAPLGLAV